MKRVYGVLLGCVLLVSLLLTGCSSGGSTGGDTTASLSKGQGELESVTTNLEMDADSAATALRSASREFATVLQSNPNDAQAKLGYAMANTLIGFFDLTVVLPKNLRAPLLRLITAARMRAPESPATTLALMAEHALRSDTRSTVRDVQLRIASRTLENAKAALPYFDALEAQVAAGATVHLRLYEGGRIRTAVFGASDVKLLNAFANLTVALCNLAVAFNLDMPAGTPLRALPVDANNNGIFESSEYLIGYPFLEKSSGVYLTQFIAYLGKACDKAAAGASLQNHASGPDAFLDVTNDATAKMLRKLNSYASALSLATTVAVGSDGIFGDHVMHYLDLAKLPQITSVRNLMPTFQKNNLSAPGIWPDPTFGGVITPGMPQGFVKITYADLQGAY